LVFLARSFFEKKQELFLNARAFFHKKTKLFPGVLEACPLLDLCLFEENN
jgi:hypothetical protein